MNPLMKFCPECHNLLCPKEDKKRKILLNACRLCKYQEVATYNCVYRHELDHPVEQPVLQNAYEDPTLPRSKELKCPLCRHPKPAYFVGNPKESVVLTYACCNPSCGHNWRVDED